jgi:hypothetical protein|tara:strand:- start:124 stop:483 length:360 start_codon:yes stop_codon:yes gene_type:complete
MLWEPRFGNYAMDTDLNFEVWLKTYDQTPPAIIVPYLKSNKSQVLHYQVDAKNIGASGTSRTSQSGYMNVIANQPQALTRLVISRSDTQHCNLEIVIKNATGKQEIFRFDCMNNASTEP